MFPTWKENKPVSVMSAVLLAGLTLFFGVKTWNDVATHAEIGHEPRGRDTIQIDGDAKVTAKPTLALVSIGLLSEGKDIPAVQVDNTTKVNAITDAMKGLGVAEADLQTSNYVIQPHYEYLPNEPQKLVGYQVTQTLDVKVRDLTKIGDALSKAGQLGANQINGVTFTIDDPKELQQQARMKALADAQKKAQELAAALGITLGHVVTFSESSGGMPVPQPMYAMDKMSMGAVAPAAPDIQAGSLDVTSNVSVTFEVR